MTAMPQRIGFLGAGHMARAIAGGIVRAGLADGGQIAAADPSPEARDAMAQTAPGCTLHTENVDVVRASEVLILATKPFQVDSVCAAIAADANESHLIISICAGVPTKFIEGRLRHGVRVVRVMPNTPALVGLGAAAVAGGAHATVGDLSVTESIFRAIGVVERVDESLLDLVTGLTGSGPAYVYAFAESLIASAVRQGLETGAAERLVKQTLLGAAKLAVESREPLEALRRAVTTPGGTTEAGLRMLNDGGFAEIIDRCVAAAAARSRELAPED